MKNKSRVMQENMEGEEDEAKSDLDQKKEETNTNLQQLELQIRQKVEKNSSK